MDRNFHNEEFEEFLKQKADQYKMYPSDRVWNNVNRSIHYRRRWFTLGFVLLLIFTAGVVSRNMLPGSDSQLAQRANKNTVLPSIASSPVNTSVKENLPAFFSSPERIVLSKETEPILFSAKTNKETTTCAAPSASINFDNVNGQLGTPEKEAMIFENNSVPDASTMNHERGSEKIINGRLLSAALLPPSIATPRVEKKEKLIAQNENAALNIEAPSKNKWSLQLYASPIVSYRRLSNLSTNTKYIPVAVNYGSSIDNYVHHKPAIGFELGTKMQYNLTNSLSIYVGAQLNYSRYYIDAYNYHAERASIALNSNPAGDTVSSVTSIRNFGGISPEQLQNQYFQMSLPLGAELVLLGESRLQLSIAASVQPTYLISSNSYLLSSDFKNYVQNPDLDRRFNVHTNFEAFVSYKLGGLKWQLGPQFRYQLLSSYSNKYPIREYLTEFGIKLGVTKTIK